MTTAKSPEFEDLLREAFAPVEPPGDLSQRLEATLVNLAELAHEELETWELSAMRDPRNWVRPAAAAAIGTTAGAALVILRVRTQAKRRSAQGRGIGGLAQRSLRSATAEARRLFDAGRKR